MRRSLLLPPLSLLLLLLAAVPALAGGWATVGLDSTPAGASAGKPWNVNITVLQHGTTPVDGITPFVKIISSAGVTKRLRRDAHGGAGRVPRAGRLPVGRHLDATRSTTASWVSGTATRQSRSPARRRQRRPRRPPVTATGSRPAGCGRRAGRCCSHSPCSQSIAAATRPTCCRRRRSPRREDRDRDRRSPRARGRGDGGPGVHDRRRRRGRPRRGDHHDYRHPGDRGPGRPRRLGGAGLRLVSHARGCERPRRVRARPRNQPGR